MDDTQLLKGILEACVLSLISRNETYGYEIMQNLSRHQFSHVKDGTLYPILARLEKKGFIISRLGESSLGPKRKYFNISDKGLGHLNTFVNQYQSMIEKANTILLSKGA